MSRFWVEKYQSMFYIALALPQTLVTATAATIVTGMRLFLCAEGTSATTRRDCVGIVDFKATSHELIDEINGRAF